MKISTLGILLASAISTSAFAGNADYVYTPIVEHGEREIDFKFGSGTPEGGEKATVTSLGYGYGATEYWFTELYLKREVEGDASKVTLVEWENKFQLLETGKYPIDLGFITEIEVPINGTEPWEIKVGPLLQTEFGKVQLNANLLLERKFANDGSGEKLPTEALYQWQAKYRLQPEFEFGAQGFGELGEVGEWLDTGKEVFHNVGPDVFGKVSLGNRQFIKYNAAWLIGYGAGAAERTVRMQLEYEF
jgi:hypothetical protein